MLTTMAVSEAVSDVIDTTMESVEFTALTTRFHLEPRCRICRDETVCVRVNELLDWRGVPIILGRGKTHMVTYADILRDLEPLNERRDKKDRITYDSLRVHAKRHYDLAGIMADWEAKLDKEMKNVLEITFEDLLNRHDK